MIKVGFGNYEIHSVISKGANRMVNHNGYMDESILVCIYYGPNGERLMRRGRKLAELLKCPLYVLTVDPLPYDQFDEEKSSYIEQWRKLSKELRVDEFIMRDNEIRPSVKVISEVAHEYNITQIEIGRASCRERVKR